MSALDRVSALIGHNPTEAFRRLQRANGRLHELRKRAAEKRADLASLRAQFYGGQTSNYDHERKVLLAEITEGRRAELIETGGKSTQGALDDYAHAHASYRGWLQVQQERRERMHRYEAELAQIDADAEAVQGEQELARQAIRLNEELIRFLRSEPQQ